MAFYDNKYWVLSHIRNSFLYSDDTGMCEMILQNGDIPKAVREEGKKLWFGPLDDSEEEYDDDGRLHARSMGSSNDDFGARRRRLNTVVRLEKMKREQQAAALISTVRWKDPDTASKEEGVEVFPKKELVGKSQASALAKLMAEHASDPDSPFVEFAKFDGQSQLKTPTRTIKIFLSMQAEEERHYPMTVCVVASAKVSELIGLVCYKYNHEKRDPPLNGAVEQFSLFIAEDDGSPDADFPCLDPKEVVGKFGFTSLALVRVTKPASEVKKEQVERQKTESPAPSQPPEGSSLESTDYHSFKGFLLHKVRQKTEVEIGISWDKVEIKPCQTARSVTTRLWSRPNVKATQLPMEVVVDCVDMRTEPGSVAIMYYDTDKRKWRRFRIECSSKTIEQITKKLKFILEIRGGLYRQEYVRHTSSVNSKRGSIVRSLVD
nr:EOG090X072S [Moina brachiata]